MSLWFRFSAAIAALSASAMSQAEWHRASSDHFIIYANDDPAELKRYAETLERFDATVRLARSMSDPPIGDGNRLTVFIVPDVDAVQRLKRGNDIDAAGFYMARGAGSVAVVPKKLSRRSTAIPQEIFFHEYAHHLMFADLKTPMPTWLVEGFAEFYSTVDINADGSVGIGEAPPARANTLRSNRAKVPLSDIMAGGQMTGWERASLYARGWLLTHYLTFTPARQGQLERYLAAIATGVPSLDAAKAALGDLGALERELDKYLLKEKFPYLTLPANRIDPGKVVVEPLPAGAIAVLPLFMRQQVRNDPQGPQDQLAEAQALAVAHPNDPMVAMVLAEAALWAKDAKAADRAASRAVELAPQSAEAHILKGRAMFALAEGRADGVTFANARGWFNHANRLDPENPEPLLYFYRTFTEGGEQPTANAIEALHYASNLAPQDLGLRMNSAVAYLNEGKLKEARRTLVPVAYSPHGGGMAAEARRMIARIDAGDAKGALRRPRPETKPASEGS